MDGWFLWFSTETAGLLTAFFVFFVVLHVALILVARLDKVGWKRTEYVWLLIAATGLLGAAGKARVLVSSMQLDLAQSRAKAAHGWAKDQVDFVQSHTCNFQFERTENSPPDFDEIVKQYRDTCTWIEKFAVDFPPYSAEDPPELALRGLPAALGASATSDLFESIQNMFDHYEASRKDVISLKSKARQSPTDAALIIFSPILLCFAVALRFAKATGELQIELAARDKATKAAGDKISVPLPATPKANVE